MRLFEISILAEGNQKFRPSSFDPMVGLAITLPYNGPTNVVGIIRKVGMTPDRKTVTLSIETETPVEIALLDESFAGEL